MRTLYFLFPQMNIRSGGHLAQLRLMESASAFCQVQAVTYQIPEDGFLDLDYLLATDIISEDIFFIHWGPHVPELLQRLAGRNIVYVSYSTGYNFDIPADVPILAGSRHTQAYWGRHSPASPIFYLPCIIPDQFKNLRLSRPIDVLVQKRKTSSYTLEELVPQLQKFCSVTVLDDWVDDLAYTFNHSKVYLYDSTAYWVGHQLSEGFGLPPLEALACGCVVFSSLNDALSDYLDPVNNCQQLHVYSLEYDIERILRAVRNWDLPQSFDDPAVNYRKPQTEERLRRVLSELDVFFDFRRRHLIDVPTENQDIPKNVLPITAHGLDNELWDRIKQYLGHLKNHT